MSQQRQRGVRPVLLFVVYGAFLVVVGVTATMQTALVSLHFSAAAVNATAAADGAIVRTFANDELTTADLGDGADPARVSRLQDDLVLLASRAGIERIDVRDASGLIRLTTEPAARGTTPASGADFERAIGGSSSATMVAPGGSIEEEPGTTARYEVLRESFPLLDAAGRTAAVIGVRRDARPILATLGDVQGQMLAITLAASIVAAILLSLVFRAAQDRIRRQTAALLESTRRDPLTGMLNHGALVAELTEALDRARAVPAPIGAAIIDLDNFRILNDVHGHAAGDAALVRLARAVERHLPPDVIAGRYGPDEFLLIAPAAAIAGLKPAVDGLRNALVDESLQFGASERLPITISAGIATSPSDADSATELLAVAAQVLGEARASGGDAVRVAGHAAQPSEAARAFNVLQGLVFTIDTKDRYTRRHSEDVARYAVFLARRLGLEPSLIDTLRVAGLLHDVGKVGIPEAILRKPGKLTAAEYDAVKQHVALGDAIVRDLVKVEVVRLGIRHHHERWDGRGYLDGLAGEEIPLVARILAVGDAFSAMTTTRPYRKALSVEEALARLTDAGATQLDEHLVTAFVEGIESAPDAPLPDVAPTTPLWLPADRVA